jgi:hypothetical protein
VGQASESDAAWPDWWLQSRLQVAAATRKAFDTLPRRERNARVFDSRYGQVAELLSSILQTTEHWSLAGYPALGRSSILLLFLLIWCCSSLLLRKLSGLFQPGGRCAMRLF